MKPDQPPKLAGAPVVCGSLGPSSGEVTMLESRKEENDAPLDVIRGPGDIENDDVARSVLPEVC